MEEIELSKKVRNPVNGDASEKCTLWIDGTTLYWMRQYLRWEPSAWFVKKRDEGSKEFETVKEAEEAAKTMIAERKAEGFVVRENAPPIAIEQSSKTKKGVPKPAWFNTLPKSLLAQHAEFVKKATTKGLAHRFNEIEALMRPGIRLSLKKTKLTDLKGKSASHIGGEPDLAPKHAWPRWNNVPLTFVAQIVITPDIKKLDLENILPKEGMLSFFAQLDPGVPEYGERGVILYTPSTKSFVRTPAPKPKYVLKTPGLYTPKGRLTIAPSETPAIEALDLNRDEQRTYHNDLFLNPIPEGPQHLLLGWANATTLHDLKKKRFLAQFDSDHRINFQMGDYDTLRFYIHSDVVDTKTVKTAVCTLSQA